MLFAHGKMSRVGTFILSHTLDWSFFAAIAAQVLKD
jgi:hypothetical protein